MGECVFCMIAARRVPSASVWDDGRTFAFLDIHPLARGHALLVPKRHAARLEDAPPEDAAALAQAAQALAPALCAEAGARDATIAINNGPDAGQEVPHLHIHIIPRTPGDGAGPVHALFRNTAAVTAGDLEETAKAVRARLEPS